MESITVRFAGETIRFNDNQTYRIADGMLFIQKKDGGTEAVFKEWIGFILGEQ